MAVLYHILEYVLPKDIRGWNSQSNFHLSLQTTYTEFSMAWTTAGIGLVKNS